MNEKEIKDLELEIEDFGKRKHQSGAHLPLQGKIAKIALDFLGISDLRQENFFKKLLENRNYHFKFLALYTFIKAQKQGIQLQKETLEVLKKIGHNHCPKMALLFRCLENKLKAEQAPSQMRR